MMRDRAVRVLRGCLVLMLLACAAVISFIEEASWLRELLRRERHGCTLAHALRAVPQTVGHRRLRASFAARSRIVRRDPDGLELWRTPVGDYWAPAGEGESFLFVLAEVETGIYESEPVAVRPADVVLDAGAHVGTFSRRALARGASLVVAIEPGARQFECLKRNLAAEIAAGRVHPVQEGVWDRQAHLALYSNSDSATASMVFSGAGSSSTQTPVTTIDLLVSRFHLRRVDFIKMDIEGAEQQALSGATATLARFMPRLAVAAYHWQNDAVRIPAIVGSANGRYAMESIGCRLDLVQIRPLTMFFR